ncbi:MAG: NUDIX domain-containing protein [Pseudomonadota bacterium]
MTSTEIPKPSYGTKDVEVLSKENRYQGFFRMEKIKLRHRLFSSGWSQPIDRELFVRGNAVAALMYDPEADTIGLVEQFRVGSFIGGGEAWLYEVVAGMTEKNETPEQVIIRELSEEAGMQPKTLIPICEYFSSPGGTSEKLHLYCALGDLSDVGGIHGLEAEAEDIKVHILPAEEVLKQLYGGQFNNAATLICLQWLLIYRDDLRNV